MPRIFFSHSSADQEITERLAKLLEQVYEQIWSDQDLTGGDEWWERIVKQISSCDHFIFLVSREALESEYCQKELSEAERQGKHIVPILVRAKVEIPEKIQKLQQIDMSKTITVDNLNQLHAAIAHYSGNITSTDYDKTRAETDRKLLGQLWPLISIRNIERLDDETQYAYIDPEFYHNRIQRYLWLRDLYNNPQNKFFHNDLEAAFEKFDAALRKYNSKMGLEYSEDWELTRGEKSFFVSNWKIVRLRGIGITKEILDQKEKGYWETVDLVLEARKQHRSLVGKIRSIFPDFDFPEPEEEEEDSSADKTDEELD